MGNSNINQAQSESNHDEIQLYYHSKLYGKHRIVSKEGQKVEKRYVIVSEQENLQFQSLVNNYHNISHPSIIKMESVDMQPVDGPQKIKYMITYEYCPSNLNAEIYLHKFKPYQAVQIIEMIEQISSALIVLTKERFPCGVLTPDKIGIMTTNEMKRYCVTVDLLMNGEQYRNLQILHDQATKRYLSPQESAGKNISTWEDIHSPTLVYSLGLIALKMIYGEDIPRQKVKECAFNLKDKFCYQFATLIVGMVQESPSNRYVFQEILEQIKLIRKSSLNLECTQRVVRRGYDCVESTYFFQQTPVPRKMCKKLAKKTHKK